MQGNSVQAGALQFATFETATGNIELKTLSSIKLDGGSVSVSASQGINLVPTGSRVCITDAINQASRTRGMCLQPYTLGRRRGRSLLEEEEGGAAGGGFSSSSNSSSSTGSVNSEGSAAAGRSLLQITESAGLRVQVSRVPFRGQDISTLLIRSRVQGSGSGVHNPSLGVPCCAPVCASARNGWWVWTLQPVRCLVARHAGTAVPVIPWAYTPARGGW